MSTVSDPIERPAHYAEGRQHEPIDVIEDWQLGFCLGNCLKYIARAGRKGDELEDLQKARWYLDREIKRLQRTERGEKRGQETAEAEGPAKERGASMTEQTKIHRPPPPAVSDSSEGAARVLRAGGRDGGTR